MSDKGPDWKAEQLKVKIGIETLKVGLIRSKLEITEAEGRVKAAQKNTDSTNEAIKNGQERLDELINTHGDLINEVTNDG